MSSNNKLVKRILILILTFIILIGIGAFNTTSYTSYFVKKQFQDIPAHIEIVQSSKSEIKFKQNKQSLPVWNEEILASENFMDADLKDAFFEVPISNKPILNLKSYSVTVSANEQLTMPGTPGELRVWIGISSKVPHIHPEMSIETRKLKIIGETAKVKPFSLGIDVEPKESICVKISPSGSEIRFKLFPNKAGVFTVGADIELYNSKDCTGAAIPKSTESVKISVTVDSRRLIIESIGVLLKKAWSTFLEFYENVLFLIFALLLFLIRKKLYKLFKFKG